jgi:hypothetical protein
VLYYLNIQRPRCRDYTPHADSKQFRYETESFLAAYLTITAATAAHWKLAGLTVDSKVFKPVKLGGQNKTGAIFGQFPYRLNQVA